MTPFDALDEMPVPDQWDEIQQRLLAAPSDQPPMVAPQVREMRRRMLVPALVAVVTGALAVGVLTWSDDDAGVIANDPPTTEPRDPAGPGDEPTTLVCPDGGLRAPTIPVEADPAPVDAPPEGDARQYRSWTSDAGVDLRLLLPGLQYIDFAGSRTEEIADPPGTLVEAGPDFTHFIGSTGFAGPCDTYEVAATGATTAARREAVLETARGFEFDATMGTTDCGPLSEAPLHVVAGDNAMAAVRDVEPADLLLSATIFETVSDLHIRPDGRCEITVAARGGLRPVATISGDDGTYGLDAVRGFAPNGTGLQNDGTVQLDVAASVSVQGTSFSVLVDYWCASCAHARLTLHYPEDDLTVTTERTDAGAFTGELPRPSTPGAHGWVTIVWSAANGDGRGVWTTNVSSGDFAAG